ncbi:MAG TPA: hypothetical protein PKD64_09445 [Pirellulaceae bacterium]|nr:hypothetical protein [Pirellulaceae bacterium]HMO92411.1 hypothetical protein [Pirellulaceae bacterium]HMP69530.1 hypothetical protein [Pirellulaceae bacterium]
MENLDVPAVKSIVSSHFRELGWEIDAIHESILLKNSTFCGYRIKCTPANASLQLHELFADWRIDLNEIYFWQDGSQIRKLRLTSVGSVANHEPETAEEESCESTDGCAAIQEMAEADSSLGPPSHQGQFGKAA